MSVLGCTRTVEYVVPRSSVRNAPICPPACTRRKASWWDDGKHDFKSVKSFRNCSLPLLLVLWWATTPYLISTCREPSSSQHLQFGGSRQQNMKCVNQTVFFQQTSHDENVEGKEGALGKISMKTGVVQARRKGEADSWGIYHFGEWNGRKAEIQRQKDSYMNLVCCLIMKW